MTGEPSAPANAAWLERFTAEVARGRHVILHGNVRDLVRWNKAFQPTRTAIAELLSAFGYQLTGYYDVVDGLTFTGGDGEREFHRLAAGRPAAAPGSPASTPGPASGNGRAADARDRMERALRTADEPTFRSPYDAIAAIRVALRQQATPVAFIIDLADLIVTAPDRADTADKRLLGTLVKAMNEAAQTGNVRNLLVFLVEDLGTLPAWLYRGRSCIQAVEAALPTFDERHVYLYLRRNQFHQANLAQNTGDDLRILANLSDGMGTSELDGLWRMSRLQRVPLDEPRSLMKRTLFGPRRDPWRRVAGRLGQARQALEQRVIGQPAAVGRVCQALAAATTGIDFVADPHSAESRPKGIFFFVGPTGVGKTELARALSEFVFDDETALARFDMSTFAEAHTAERLTGAPPGYVGHERGGELTNRMHQRPFSVLLFDEIEKAHPSIFDKFLQVLDDGRLTDALGRTAYFSESIIIFTSNLGAAESHAWLNGGALPDYPAVVAHFEGKVRDHFTKELGRPELLGRLGSGITVFDILRPELVHDIGRKLLGQLVASAARREVILSLDEAGLLAEVGRRTRRPEALGLGVRGIRDILGELARDPLIAYLQRHRPPAALSISMTASGPMIRPT